MRQSVVAFVVVLSLAVGQTATAAASSEVNGEEIRTLDRPHGTFGYNGAPQGDREAGAYPIVFTNTSTKGPHEIVFFRLAPAHRKATKAQIIAAIDNHDSTFIDYIAGGAFTGPQSTTTSVGPDFNPGPVQLLPGRYVYLCGEAWPNGIPHYRLGMFATFFAK